MTRAGVLLLGMLALPPGLWAGAGAVQASPVSEYMLDNGLKVIVKVDRRAPVVVSQIWYKVGSSYESGGATGVSHVLEHMMFKGTERHPAGEFSRIIAAHGGRENAFTGRDYTAYFQRLEKSRLEISLELEADRMKNLLLPADEFDKELQVVIEERRMRTDDKPSSLAFERFNATAWQNSPYRQPVIGWRADLDSMTVADLRAWYRRWYAPDNATLVVVGDVDPEAVRDMAEAWFGDIPRSDPAPVKPRTEAEQNGEKRIVVRLPARLPALMMGYKVPTLRTAADDAEAYALEVLAEILDGDDSARLTRDLVRGSEVAAAAGAGYDLYNRLDGLLLLQGTPSGGRDVRELEAAFRAQVERLRTELVDRRELDRVKTRVVTADVYQRDSIFYQAMRIGMLETVGLGWRVMDEYLDRVRAVTPGQIREVARRYLVDDRLTVGELVPLPMDGAADTQEAAGAAH